MASKNSFDNIMKQKKLEELGAKYGVGGTNGAATTGDKNGRQGNSSAPSSSNSTKKPTDYSSAVKYLSDRGIQGASGIMTETEWRRRKKSSGHSTYQSYLDEVVSKHGGNMTASKITDASKENRVVSLIERLEDAKYRTTDKCYDKRLKEEMERLEKEYLLPDGNYLYPPGAHAQSIVDEEFEAAQKEVEELTKQFDRFKSGAREANWYDSTIGAVKKGYYNMASGKQSFEQMEGRENEAEKYKELLLSDEYNTYTDNKAKQVLQFIGEFLGQQAYNLSDPRTIGLTATAGGMATAAGQAGPQALFPEEIISVPAAMAFGYTSGAALNTYETSAGHTYETLKELGVSNDVARNAAHGVGFGVGLLEALQLDELVDAYTVGVTNGASDDILKVIASEILKRTKNTASETTEEVLQELVTIGGEEIAYNIDKGEGLYTADDIKERLGETATTSLLGFGAMNVPAAAINTTRSAINNRNNNARDNNISIEQQPTTPYTLEQAAADVVVDRSAAQEGKKQPVSNTSAMSGNLSAQGTSAQKTSTNARESATPQSQKGVSQSGADIPSSYGARGKAAFREIMSENNWTPEQTKRRFQSAYELGLTEAPRSKISLLGTIQETAYNAGRQDAILSMKKEDRKGTTIWGKNGGLVENEHTKRLDNQTFDTLNKIGKATGSKIIFERIPAEENSNGYYRASDGTIHIDINTDKPIMTVVKHELTHRLQTLAKREYRAFRNYAVSVMNGSSPFGHTATEAQRLDYLAKSDGKINLTTEEAMDEIAANFTERILTDEKALNDFVNHITSSAENMTMGQKFFQVVREFIDKVKAVFNGDRSKMDAAAQKEFGATLSQLEKAERLWKKAYASAAKRVSESGFSQNTLENNSKEGYNGDIKHALKNWRTDLNKGQYEILKRKIKHDAQTSENSITDTANWYSGSIEGIDVFAIYSTQDISDPTILYERKGEQGKAELSALLNYLEEMEYGESIVEESKTIDAILENDWLQEKHDLANNNDRPRSRGSDTGYASVLQGKSSQFIGSKAFRNVIRNLFEIQERAGELNEGKRHSLKEGDIGAFDKSDPDVRYSLRQGARDDVHKVLNDINYQEEVRLTDTTPSIMLSSKGVKNLPMLMKPSHIRENVFTQQEAKNKGLSVNIGINYHGLGEDLFLKVIEDLDKVTEAYRGTKNADNTARRENYFLLISNQTDKDGNIINVPVFINEKGQYNRVFVDANKIATVFGRSELRRYISEQLRLKNLVRIKNKSTQSSEPTSPIDARYGTNASKDNILQKRNIVNTYSMQDGEKNSLKGEGDLVKDYEKLKTGQISSKEYEQLLETYGAISPGEKPARDIDVPKKTADGRKVSQTVRTILEAKATPDEAIPTIEKMVTDGEFSYDVYTDKKAISDANARIEKKGFATALTDWASDTEKGKVSKESTALGWALYNNAANSGDIKTAMTVLNKMVQHQRSAAQALQATRILKKLSPEGQLYGAQRSVESLQQELTDKYGDKAPELKIDEKLAEQFLKAETQEERDAIAQEIYKDIGRQMPSRFIDKWNAWRYLAMLGNARTHVRNVVGNAGFAPIVLTKNLTAAAIESVVSRVSGKKTVRGKAIIKGNKSDRALLKAAWSDYGNVADLISNGGKYNDAAMANQYIEEGRQIFKLKPLELARKKNSQLLEAEDMWFSKPHYAYALAQYCKANNITAEQIKRGRAIEPAREYAIKEAQKATYRDTNAFSQFISELGRSGNKKNPVIKGASVALEGILPFRKTPANILVRGVEYSPLGLLKGLSYDLAQVNKGKMSATEAIDNISAGLTGTGLLALGVLLASQGLIRGHGEDEKDEKEFKELMGHQSYALELPSGQSITLDWLAPEALPFFVGVNIWESTKGADEETNFSTILQSVTNITEPMLEMSCLQGLNDLIEGMGYASSNDTSGLVALLSSAATSYLTQGIPTLSGQTERTSEENRMTTYTEKNDFLTGDMQYTLGKASAKIPFWDYNQIPYIDAWGRKEASGSALKRGFNNFLNPAYTSTVESSRMEKELLRLYEKTGESGVFPERADKYFTVDGKRKDLTANEYVRYATLKGEKSYKLVSDLVNSKAYKTLSDEEKAKAVREAYDYANQKAKQAISNYKPDTWVEKADEFGSNVGGYISFKTEVSGTKEDNGGKISKQEVVDIVLDMAQDDPEAWKMYLSMYDSDSDKYAYENGIEGEDYMYFLEALADVDTPTKSGKYGTYTQAEATSAVNRLDGLTREEKAVLWQSVNTGWKKNPFR